MFGEFEKRAEISNRLCLYQNFILCIIDYEWDE